MTAGWTLPPNVTDPFRRRPLGPSGGGRADEVPDLGIGSVGARLKTARERQGIALADAAHAVHIPHKTLQALEDGRYDVLPRGVYGRGFVRLYAEYLHLDGTALVSEFTAEQSRMHMVAADPQLRLRPVPLRKDGSGLSLSPRATLGIGILLIGIVALGYLFVEARAFLRAPLLELSEPAGNREVAGTTVTVRGTTDPTAEVRINGERTYVRDNGSFEEVVGIGEGVNTIRVVAKSIGGKERTIARDVLVRRVEHAASPSPGGTPTPLPAPDQPFTLTVRAEDASVWVSLTVDGAQGFSGILLPGSSQDAVGKDIRVTSGKARNTRILADGQDAGVLSDSPGTVRDVAFTRAKASGTVERQTP